MTKLYQCDLECGERRTRAYIEEKSAVVGTRGTLRDAEDTESRWTVVDVPNVGIEERYLQELKTAYRKQREASDI